MIEERKKAPTPRAHEVRAIVQKLRPWKGALIAVAPEAAVEAYHRWAVRLEFDTARFPRRAHPAGLNVIGYLRSASGIGESARALIRSAGTAGVATALINASGGHGDRDEENLVGSPGLENPYDVNLFCVNSFEMKVLRERLGGAFFANRVNVGYWYWELPALPASHADRFDSLDEIWVASEFVRRAVEARAPADGSVRVRVLPPCVPLRRPGAEGAPSRGAAFVFLAMADAGSVLERKNPAGAIEAFRRAFGDDPAARLVVKINHPEADPAGVEQLRAMAGGGNILLIDRLLPREAIDSLLFGCDAFVSLHRSEGFALPCAEAMALGKPVVATDYSGSVDFVRPETGYPVPYRLVALDHDAGPYEKGGLWADPDLDAAAEAMRFVFDHREEARARGRAGADLVRALYSPAVVGERIRRRLGELRRARK